MLVSVGDMGFVSNFFKSSENRLEEGGVDKGSFFPKNGLT
jgi:hypothetical protein